MDSIYYLDENWKYKAFQPWSFCSLAIINSYVAILSMDIKLFFEFRELKNKHLSLILSVPEHNVCV